MLTISETQTEKKGAKVAEEKEPKPRVLYKLSIDLWDDGEIDTDIVELVKGERGRPKAWRKNPKAFKDSLKQQLSESPDLVVDEILRLFSINPLEYAERVKGRASKIEAQSQDGEYDEE